MKYFIYITFLVSFFSCKDAIEKPKEILPKDKMSKMIADFAINEQSSEIGFNINSENATRFILKKYKVKGDLFTKSYEFYMTRPNDIKEILEESQNIIFGKDPKAKIYIEKKLKESQETSEKAN